MNSPQRRKGESDFEVHPSGTYKMISETSLHIKVAVGLLEQAKCPNESCRNGSIFTQAGPTEHDMEPCQFCSMRKEIIEEMADE